MAGPTHFTAVIQLAGHYAAAYFQQGKVSFISPHPEKDRWVAQSTAVVFAAIKDIYYDPNLKCPKRPLISIIEKNGEFFPVALGADGGYLIETNLYGFGTSESAARAFANTINSINI